ncbi:MAG: LacI family DNA-binding transcriptional regulator [Rhizobiaceae bacterium]|nr:LacI family DNA-binding transcriptional regulator [Rhizobiaceae bacterium]
MSKKRVTLKFLSERTGFDVSTISRVLRNDAAVSIRPENMELIKRIAREFNYVPDTAARSLRSSRSYSIGTVLPSLQNQIHAQIVEGASRVCRERGYSLVIAHLANEISPQQVVGDLINHNRIEGLMSLTFRPELREMVNSGDHEIPVMAVNWRASGFRNYVALDERPGARMATEHLLDLGHRRIAHLSGDRRRFNAAERFAGYQDALDARGIAVDPALIEVAGYGYEEGFRAMSALVARSPGAFTAVFAVSLLTAAGAIAVMNRHGIRVPEDVSVVGFNDGMLAEVTNPTITTVAYPLDQVGASAAEGMISLLEGRLETYQDVIGAPKLMRRSSTAEPARPRAIRTGSRQQISKNTAS